MRSSVAFAFAFVVLAMFVPASALAADFTVTASFPTYTVNGQGNPTLTLNRGQTYTFQVTASGHPFYIKTAQVTGTGSTFDTGVTNNGVETGTLTFTVPASAPSTLFYQCAVHTPMTGTLSIVGATPAPMTGVYAVGLLMVALGAAGLTMMRTRARAR